MNFRLNRAILVPLVLKELLGDPDFGGSKVGQGKRVILEYSSPNLGKPMHVGHIRSTLIGDSLARILGFTGHDIFRLNYLGDIGLHMGKLMAAYDRWGDRSRLIAQPMQEMLDLYVRFHEEEAKDPSLTSEAAALLGGFETRDESVVGMWDLIRENSLQAFNRVYDMLDVTFDEITGQSFFTEPGKRIIQTALEKGIARRLDRTIDAAAAVADLEDESELAAGGVVVPLEKHGLPDKVVLRSDGTAIYSTQDLGAAVARYERFEFDSMVYIVGAEQKLYFQQVFKILEIFGFEWVDRCIHIPFGHIRMETGKMSTRAGNVVFLEDVLTRAIERAKEIAIEKVSKDIDLDAGEVEKIARAVGIGAMKYAILSTEHVHEVRFSWESALNFEANSAPYIQYTHARASRLLERSKQALVEDVDVGAVTDAEFGIVKILDSFPDVVEECASRRRMVPLCQYLNSLANAFGTYYHDTRILGSDQEHFRVTLTGAVKQVLGTGLGLLGVEAPERM